MHSTTQCHALVLGTTGTTYIRQQQKYIGREKYEINKNKNKNKKQKQNKKTNKNKDKNKTKNETNRALPWWRVPVPMSTKFVRYHAIITVHYRGGWLPW